MSTDPLLIHDASGYKLTDEDMSMWKNVEYIICTAIDALQAGRNLPLEHQEPLPPSRYGYTRSHSQEKFAKKSVLKSLNAFQRLLAYCSYSLAGRNWTGPGSELPLSDLQSTFSVVYAKLDTAAPSVHIMAKNLFSTLSDMYNYRNFTGVVLRWDQPYDFPAIHAMYHHNVPVYVTWPDRLQNPYISLHQSHYLKRWLPSPPLFEALEQTPHLPAPVNDSPNTRIHLSVQYKETYESPMEYVNMRLQQIPTQLDRSPNKQRMLDRLRSAQKFTSIGSAKYYCFEQVAVVDQQTGESKERWVRRLLTKHEAVVDFECTDNEQLWYGSSVSSHFCLLNGRLGLIVS
jgi:hypothetical protein